MKVTFNSAILYETPMNDILTLIGGVHGLALATLKRIQEETTNAQQTNTLHIRS